MGDVGNGSCVHSHFDMMTSRTRLRLACLFATSITLLIVYAISYTNLAESLKSSTVLSISYDALITFTALSAQKWIGFAEAADSGDKIQVGMIFTKAANNHQLKTRFKVCVESMFEYVSKPVRLHIIGDDASLQIAQNDVLEKLTPNQKHFLEYELHQMEPLAQGVTDLLGDMINFFRKDANAYYGDNLFFISMVLYGLFPRINRIIMLDSDLKFRADIADLWTLFGDFDDDNVMGIARDAQPVYRHMFHQYRRQNPSTRVGDPPPDGLTGFNSGVLLLDLERMRQSERYLSLLDLNRVTELANKYTFQGHLGDQDFYSLICMEYEHLFFVLPCVWNRQLCRWWERSYTEVFEEYFRCDGDVKIYHGNCNTPIPNDEL